MQTIDLSHLIEPSMPIFPGTEEPILASANTIAQDGFAEKKITMYSHTGTHMDAPAHMLPGGKTLDAYEAASFFGKAVLVDLTSNNLVSIGIEHLRPREEDLKHADFLILRTGWAERWGEPEYFHGFPALTSEAAAWLVGLEMKGIGIDAISIDRIEDNHFPIHHILFNAGIFVIENLTNLDKVGKEFMLACFPLRIQGSDGSPIRAVGLIP